MMIQPVVSDNEVHNFSLIKLICTRINLYNQINNKVELQYMVFIPRLLSFSICALLLSTITYSSSPMTTPIDPVKIRLSAAIVSAPIHCSNLHLLQHQTMRQ